MGNNLINRDFLTPKKKSPDETKDEVMHEYTANEFAELSDRIKEIKHYEAEVQSERAKKVTVNPRNGNQISNIPNWALLSVSTIPRRAKEIRDTFHSW